MEETKRFKIGDEVNHTTFGKGVVVYVIHYKDAYDRLYDYVDVAFENDTKISRKFTTNSLLKHLVKEGEQK